LPEQQWKRGRKIALFEGILAGASFGTAAVFIRLIGGVDIFSIAFWRLTIAFLVLGATILLLRSPFKAGLLKRFFPQVLFLGVLLGTHFVLFASAVMDTTIINATVLVNTTPIWAMILSVLISGVSPTRRAVLGIVVSFLGLSVIAYADASSPTFSLNLKGDLEALLAAVVEALYLSWGRATRRKVPILSLMFFIYMLSAVAVLAASVVMRSGPLFSAMSWEAVPVLVGLGVLPTSVAHSLYFSSLSGLKSFETATLALLEPIAATLLGIILFVEIPSALFILGAVFVLGGMVSVTLQRGS
jgi:drug/metabolite transporter (DMT)-like permease